MTPRQTNQLGGQERLLLTVVEQLCRPLLHISRLSELTAAGPDAEHWQQVQAIADAGLQLAESYALQLRTDGKVAALEPITLSGLLYDTAHALAPYAKTYDVELQFEAGPRTYPVYANRGVLQSALTALGHVFVAAEAACDEPGAVRLAAHRSRYGMVAGVYAPRAGQNLAAESLRQAQRLYGRAYQPLQRMVAGPAAGVFVADALLQTMRSRLHVARLHSVSGLAATLPAGRQLQLV